MTAIIGGIDDIGTDGDGGRRRGGERRRGGDRRGRGRRRVSQEQALPFLPPLPRLSLLDWFRFSPSFFETSLGSVAATFDAARPTLS